MHAKLDNGAIIAFHFACGEPSSAFYGYRVNRQNDYDSSRNIVVKEDTFSSKPVTEHGENKYPNEGPCQRFPLHPLD